MILKKSLFMAAITSILLTSCENSNKKEREEVESGGSTETVEVPAVTENNDLSEIQLNSGDNMKFDRTEIVVNAGKTVRLTLTHTGTMPKSAMGHNFVLLKQGIDIAAFGNAAAQNGTAPDYEITESLLKDVIIHTKMIGGGESVTIEFPAPDKGTYNFICSFPGHFGMMQGKFIVQ